MKKPEGDGINCDYCGVIHSIDFTYYSLDFFRVDKVNQSKSQSDNPELSADLCESCMKIFKDRVIAAYKPPVSGKFFCDISGEIIIAPVYTYYHCQVSQAIVKLSTSPFICITCKKQRDPEQGPCEQCVPESRLERSGEPTVDRTYLEINFSKSMFEKFKGHLDFINNGVAEWASQSS